jgi:chondroitin synthase
MSRSSDSILSKANQAFANGDYKSALELYLRCKERYGESLISFNIKICQARLAKANTCLTPESSITAYPIAISSKTGASIKLNSDKFDPATAYMLAQIGQIELTEYQKQQCIEKHKQFTSRKSEDAEVKPVNPIPADWPNDLVLSPLPESPNDFRWHLARKIYQPKQESESPPGLSVIIPTFNRSKILDVTLACLVNQETKYPFEVIVADDGSKESIDLIIRQYEQLLDIKYARQRDYGFQVSAVRNLGMRASKYEFLAFLDCDMAPNPGWIDSYMQLLCQDDGIALVGPRKYVDTMPYDPSEFRNNKKLIEQLPEVRTNNKVAGKNEGYISVDWRLDHFRKTEDLRLCDSPFRYFAGGNIAFAKRWLKAAGWFDEDFEHWGGEDLEFGYRLFRHGCFFRVAWGSMAYHQEPPGKENETDREEGVKITDPIKNERIPYFYRKLQSLESSKISRNPLVSIYVPACNCEDSIERCVDSALNQTIVDLEVCICNDGSTDKTLNLINERYGSNPRVHVITQVNGGIGRASNTSVRMTRGYYIGQLDSDDYLEPDAVELCLKEFLADRKLACVYTTYRNVNPSGSLIANGYNWPVYSREKLTTAMIAHHFRMFTVRAWHLTGGFDETRSNAVDYDMYLKLSEVGPFKHLNKISYNRVLHGENTSIKKLGLQKQNHFLAVNDSLARQNIRKYSYVSSSDGDSNRDYKFKENQNEK